MAVKKTYNRYFIIFQEEDKGFGIAIDKQPTGYLKIETRSGKCKITVYAQNLKKEKGPYICCMIDTSKTPPLVARLGSIPVDDMGRGETWWEFNENNIADEGETADKFSVAAILVDGKGVECPLSGLIGKEKVEWKSKIVKPEPDRSEKEEAKIEDEKKEDIKKEEDEVSAKAEKFQQYEENVKEAARSDKEKLPNQSGKAVKYDNQNITENIPKDEDNNQIENNIEDNNEPEDESDYKDSNEIKYEEDNQDKDYGIDKKNYNQSDLENGEEPYNQYAMMDESEEDMEDSRHPIENVVKQEERKEERRRTHADMFHGILKNFEEVKGLCPYMKNFRWWKIPYGYDVDIKENKYYPYFCAVYHLKMTYPYLNYIKYFKKCGYYYFGIKYDDNNEVKYIVYGVKGMNNMEHQPYMGMTGFVKWVKIDESESGMWLMFYNPYTGCIMVPKKRQK